MSLLFLIGMPASGKTYWGRKISEHYHLFFNDLDELIEEQASMKISEIFEKKGEDYFRVLEHRMLLDLIAARGTGVVACGGGTPAFLNNMLLMNDAGCTVYLETNIETLLERIERESNIRPLLYGKEDKKVILHNLLESRKPVYEQARYILGEEQISITNFAKIIDSCIDRP